MALYKEHGVNPIGSCLPLLFQPPVFMGLFFVLRGFSHKPPAGDLSFLGGFIENISAHVDRPAGGLAPIGAYVPQRAGSTLLNAAADGFVAADDVRCPSMPSCCCPPPLSSATRFSGRAHAHLHSQPTS